MTLQKRSFSWKCASEKQLTPWTLEAPQAPQCGPTWKPTETSAKASIDLDGLCTVPLRLSGYLVIDRGEVKMFIAKPSRAQGELVMNQLFKICTAQSVAFSLYEFSPCRGCAYCLWTINKNSLHHHYFLHSSYFTHTMSPQYLCVGPPFILGGNKQLC